MFFASQLLQCNIFLLLPLLPRLLPLQTQYCCYQHKDLFSPQLPCLLEAKFYCTTHNKEKTTWSSVITFKKILPPSKYGKSFRAGCFRYSSSKWHSNCTALQSDFRNRVLQVWSLQWALQIICSIWAKQTPYFMIKCLSRHILVAVGIFITPEISAITRGAAQVCSCHSGLLIYHP